MNIATASIYDLKKELETKKITATELVQAYLDRIKEHEPQVNAFLEVYDDALHQAKAIDHARANGENLGRLAGIPIAVKDNISVEGKIASAGSKILGNHKAAYDATCIKRLRDAGAIFIGRTNCDEFAMGSSTENSAYGPSKNPWSLKRTPGGSSGGSAAAVAAGFAPAALGTDTGGSVRQPASLCSLIGLKPTYGRISRYGLVALGSSLDQLSPFTRTVEDAALLMQVMSGLDDNDSTTTEADVVLPELIDKDIKGMTIGLPKEYFAEGLDKDVEKVIRDAVTWYEQNGATVKEISLPHTKYAIATYYMVMCSEASSNLARFDGIRYGLSAKSDQLDQIYKVSRGQGFGEETKRRIMLGTYALSSGYYDAYYKKALQVRALLRQDFDKALEDVDCILTPVSPTVAWKIGEKIDDPLQMYLSDIYTISLNLTALPGMAVPCGFVKDLPVGFQLASKAFDELSMFKLAKAYQSDHDWHIQDPFGWSSLLDKKKES